MRLFPTVEYAVFRETTQGWRIPLRRIPNHELVFITEGKGLLAYGDRLKTIKKNDLLYFTPEVTHSLWVEDEPYMKFFGIHFTVPEPNFHALPLQTVTELSSMTPLLPHLQQVTAVWTEKPVDYEWTQDLEMSNLLFKLLRKPYGQDAPAGHRGVRKALRVVHDEPLRLYSLLELCELSGLGKSQFTREFRLYTGQTPIAYCLRLRLSCAKEELINTADSVGEIAIRCGFQDPLYFSRQFSAHFRLSPTDFRKMNR